jgi:hypothetical protein
MIQRWKPWEKSTGPKSEEGKRKSAKRGYKGAQREEMREIARVLRAQRDCIDEMESEYIQQ